MAMTGSPRQLKKIAFLEGNWEVAMSVRPEARADWIETTGTSTFRWILDRSILEQTYEGSMMERPFKGRGYLSFNRFSHRWQHTWCDNIAAILSIYEGHFDEGRLVVTGEEKTSGGGFLVRIMWYNITDNKFDWVLETSQDGKNWGSIMKAVYIKKNS
jgi:hypothetical protein